MLTVEYYVYSLLGFEVKTDKQSGNVTLTQIGLTKKFQNTVVMLDINKNITPAATMTLETYDDGPPFD